MRFFPAFLDSIVSWALYIPENGSATQGVGPMSRAEHFRTEMEDDG